MSASDVEIYQTSLRLNVSDNLKNLKRHSGKSSPQIAKETGLARQTVNNATYYGVVGVAKLVILANYYNVSLDWLITPHSDFN